MPTEAQRLRRILRNLVNSTLRLDPTDADRPAMRAAIRELSRKPHRYTLPPIR